MLDNTDTQEALLLLWEKHGLTKAQMRHSRNRADLDYLLSQWRASVLQLYPALVDCPVRRFDTDAAIAERNEKLYWYAAVAEGVSC